MAQVRGHVLRIVPCSGAVRRQRHHSVTVGAILNDGSATALPCSVAAGGCPDGNSMGNIKAVGLTLNVQTTNVSNEDGTFPTISLSSEAKINN
jgi:hypothetical protein